MMRKILSLCLSFIFVSNSFAGAAEEFKRQNPDVMKYEFGRSYISALKYLRSIDSRWQKKEPKKVHAGDDFQIIRGSMNYLSMDNADLRIVKSYMTPYIASPNALMRKVADIIVFSCENGIALNNQERMLWEKWGDLKSAGQGTPDKERIFVKSQAEIAFKRKEADKQIIQASILMTKVLMSADNANENGHRLAITADQRKKLLKKLDSFGKDILDWGLKPGQRTLDASIAAIREVLEDSVWTSVDEK
jgi:hypothetical protein